MDRPSTTVAAGSAALEQMQAAGTAVGPVALGTDRRRHRGLVDLGRHGDQDLGELAQLAGAPGELEVDQPLSDLLQVVEDVVELARQVVEVLAIDGRDEGGVNLLPDLVAQLVAAVLRVAQLAREPLALAHAIRRCCEIKAEVVRQDEREGGLRAILAGLPAGTRV